MANMFDNLKQLGKLKQQASQFQKMLASKIVEVASSGQEIKLKVNGKMEILSLDINSEILKPEKKQYLEKLLIKTWTSAQKEVEKAIGADIKSQMGNFNLPF